jgi:hypothetical protein
MYDYCKTVITVCFNNIGVCPLKMIALKNEGANE